MAVLLVTSAAEAVDVDCDVEGPGALQTAVNAAAPFTTIDVTGTCTAVTIRSDKVGLILDGGDSAVIQNTSAPGQGPVAITVRGATQVTIQRFANLITNTMDGTGVFVADGASARILDNIITGNQYGVQVSRNAQAIINDSTIRNNSDSGILITETSSARIGFLFPDAAPNTIEGNGIGIQISRGASARIIANQIVNNVKAGVRVDRGSQADITANNIDGNGANGVEVLRSSSAVLGSDTGTGPTNDPNMGTSTGFAVLCSLNSSVDGRLGALNGTKWKKVEALEACVNSTRH
jgi:hypothetical protein